MKAIIYSGILLALFSFVLLPSNGKQIWKGSGEASQSVSISTVSKEGKSISKMNYTFKNIRYGTMVDTGSFTLSKKYDVQEFLSALEGAIEKIGESSKTEWTKSNYTVSVGGSSSKIKNHFRIEIGEFFCPIHKKDAKKLIKALGPEIDRFEE